MTHQQINELEAMAKFSLPESERENLLKHMILLADSFTALDAVVTDAPPLITPLAMTNVMRDDVAVQMLPWEKVLANAPEQYDGYFQVPKTIE